MSGADQLKKASEGKMEVLYLLNADDEVKDVDLSKCFVIYQGHHGDYGVKYADVILPSTAYTEKEAIYVNIEGRSQLTERAVFAPGDATNDSEILCKLLQVLGYEKSLDNVQDIREEMVRIQPGIVDYGQVTMAPWKPLKGELTKVPSKKITTFTENYYMDNVITRASAIMANCVRATLERTKVQEEEELNA